MPSRASTSDGIVDIDDAVTGQHLGVPHQPAAHWDDQSKQQQKPDPIGGPLPWRKRGGVFGGCHDSFPCLTFLRNVRRAAMVESCQDSVKTLRTGDYQVVTCGVRNTSLR